MFFETMESRQLLSGSGHTTSPNSGPSANSGPGVNSGPPAMMVDHSGPGRDGTGNTGTAGNPNQGRGHHDPVDNDPCDDNGAAPGADDPVGHH